MKLQNMAIIFIIILLPIILVLSAYLNTQMDTLKLQTSYDTILNDATYDGIKAFEINTANNEYSTVADSLKRDVSAAINTYIKSMANNLGVSGYEEEHLLPYIPAIVFTLYDGYYIYSPTRVTNDNGVGKKIEYILKPYIYYTSRYVQGNMDVVVNYTLDNYITVYGTINGEYVNESGYLVTNLEVSPDPTNMTKNDMIKGVDNKNFKVKYRGIEIQKDDLEAIEYFVFSYKFTNWVKKNLGSIVESNAKDIGGKAYENLLYAENQNGKVEGTKIFANKNNKIFEFSTSNDPEIESSHFFQHKREIIKYSIQDNLNMSISLYSQGSTSNFRMPVLTEKEWDDVTKNICMMTFFQGVPIGNKIYNNYAIVASDKNKEFAKIENLYYVDGDTTNTYHKIDCEKLNISTKSYMSGYRNIEFDMTIERTDTGEIDEDGVKGRREEACYECIVNSANYDKEPTLTLEELKENRIGTLNANDNKYKIAEECYATLARERWKKLEYVEEPVVEPDPPPDPHPEVPDGELWLYNATNPTQIEDEYVDITGGWYECVWSDFRLKTVSHHSGAIYQKTNSYLRTADVSKYEAGNGAFVTNDKVEEIAEGYTKLHIKFEVKASNTIRSDETMHCILGTQRPNLLRYKPGTSGNQLYFNIVDRAGKMKSVYWRDVCHGSNPHPDYDLRSSCSPIADLQLVAQKDLQNDIYEYTYDITKYMGKIKANGGCYVIVYGHSHQWTTYTLDAHIYKIWLTKD